MEGADLGEERPGVPRLVREMMDFGCDRSGRDEEIVRRVGHALALPRHVDHRVDDEIGNVDALWPQVARERFRKDALRGFRRRKAGEGGAPTLRRGVPGHDQRAFPGCDHCGRRQPRQVEQRHRVALEVALENSGLDLRERAERATHGVVDDDFGLAEPRNRSLQRNGIGNVARHGDRIRYLLLQGGEPIRISGQHGHAIAAFSEAARDSGARARADTSDNGERLHAARSRLARTKSSRSLPKNISSPTNIVGAPKTPRSIAASVAASSARSRVGSSIREARSGPPTPAAFSTAATSAAVASGAPDPQYAWKIAPTPCGARPSSSAASDALKSRRGSISAPWGWRWRGTL